MSRNPLRIVSIVEAVTVTGPIKPLLMFAARAHQQPVPPVRQSVVTTIRTPDGTTPLSNAFTVAATEAGVSVDLCPERFPGDPRILGELARQLARRSPDIVETHNFKSHFLFWLLRLLRGGQLRQTCWVAFHHGYTQTSWRVRLYQMLDSLTLPSATRVVTLCEPFVRQLLDRGVKEDRIDLISNAVADRIPPDASALDALRATHELNADDRICLFVGRLSVEKGCQDLIKAFLQLIERIPDPRIKLLIVGEGPEKESLIKQSRDISDRIIFTGHQTDVWPFYFLAEAFVMPSHSEGSPLVLLEALSAGCAIVATRVGGVPETVVDGQSAIVVESHDPASFARAMERVLSDPGFATQLRKAAKARSAKFTSETYSKSLLAIYERALGAVGTHRN